MHRVIITFSLLTAVASAQQPSPATSSRSDTEKLAHVLSVASNIVPTVYALASASSARLDRGIAAYYRPPTQEQDSAPSLDYKPIGPLNLLDAPRQPPNKALEPTPTAVTSPAAQEPRQP